MGKQRPTSLRCLVALLVGASTPLAFAPVGWSVVSIISLVVLFWLWESDTPRRAAQIGFCHGFGMFSVGVSWVFVSLHTYGNMPAPMAGSVVLVFVVILAVFPAMVGYLYRWFGRSRDDSAALVFGAALWVLMEWIRGWILTGFPWLSLGYSQTQSPLLGVAPLMGVYGVSLAVAFSAVCVLRIWRTSNRGRIAAALALATVWMIAWGLGRIVWVEPHGEPVRVALVQGNVGLNDKWAPGRAVAIRDLYISQSAKHRDRDLIVWPESAIPLYIDELSIEFWGSLREHPADFLFGVLERHTESGRLRYYNSVVGLGATTGVYRKRHLVPFGEYLPLKSVLSWLLEYLRIPMSDFSAWTDDQSPLIVAGHPVGVTVCYEDGFVEEVLEAMPSASILVNVSEDAWFGDSLAPHQRVQMAQMRAREVARPMLRSANTGVSAVIDHLGRVVAQSPQFEPWVLTGSVQPMMGSTPFAAFGNLPLLILLGLLTVVTIAIGPARRFLRRGRCLHQE